MKTTMSSQPATLSQHALDKRKAGVRLLIGAHADPQAIAPAGKLQITHQHARRLELLVNRFDRSRGVYTPGVVGVRVDDLETKFAHGRDHAAARGEDRCTV